MKPTDLLSLIDQNRLPHALLFCGGTLIEKREFAMKVVNRLLGEKKLHPDLLILPKEENETIKIDDVREVIAQLSQTSHQGGYKIIIFQLAESMPVGAMNALLKTLEEPPPQSLLMLITEMPNLLPATLRSRCQRVLFEGHEHNTVDKALLKILGDLQERRLNPCEAAESLQKKPLGEVLDGLYYCCAHMIQKMPINLFKWLDEINAAREKVMRKYNPNHLLTLESLFYHWTTYDARRFTLPSG